jgi:hypothetical protein
LLGPGKRGVNQRQGDQIRQIFAHWKIVFFGQFFLKNKEVPTWLLSYFFQQKMCALILTKNGLGYILGDFFTNTSGRPARRHLQVSLFILQRIALDVQSL